MTANTHRPAGLHNFNSHSSSKFQNQPHSPHLLVAVFVNLLAQSGQCRHRRGEAGIGIRGWMPLFEGSESRVLEFLWLQEAGKDPKSWGLWQFLWVRCILRHGETSETCSPRDLQLATFEVSRTQQASQNKKHIFHRDPLSASFALGFIPFRSRSPAKLWRVGPNDGGD